MNKTKGVNGGSGVYALVNRTNGRMYIGSSKNFYNRIKVHKSSLCLDKHNSKELQSDYNAGHNIDFVILEQCETRLLLSLEEKFINFFEDFVYNVKMKSKVKDSDASRMADLRDYWNRPPKEATRHREAGGKPKKHISPPREVAIANTRAPVNQICVETGEVIATYPSLNSAGLAVGASRQNIYSSVKYGGTAAGFRWVRS